MGLSIAKADVDTTIRNKTIPANRIDFLMLNAP
jgi:hypothetical protein